MVWYGVIDGLMDPLLLLLCVHMLDYQQRSDTMATDSISDHPMLNDEILRYDVDVLNVHHMNTTTHGSSVLHDHICCQCAVIVTCDDNMVR